MAAASATARDATGSARGADGSDALTTLASALPGTQTADYMPYLGGLWQAGVRDWCDAVESFGESVDEAARDGSATDSVVEDVFTSAKILFGGA